MIKDKDIQMEKIIIVYQGIPGGTSGKKKKKKNPHDPLEKEMATHPSILAWKIPWTEEPGGLQSMGSQKVKHD